MGQFKPMVKMMTTEPSIELKLKKGGHVSMKRAKEESGHKMMAGGEMPVGSRGGLPAAARPSKPSMAARRKAMSKMAEGGESKAEHKAEMKKMGETAKKLEKHASMPASKAHKGLKTGGVVMGQGGFKAGGIIKSTKGETKMVTAEGEHRTPKKTGEVVMGKPGGYKKGGSCYAKGGGVEGNVSTSKPGKTNTTTGEVKLGNAGGYKKGGSAKKAYATGGSVNDTGRAVAMPKKAKSQPVSINRLSGTFKKGGKVKEGAPRFEAGGPSDFSVYEPLAQMYADMPSYSQPSQGQLGGYLQEYGNADRGYLSSPSGRAIDMSSPQIGTPLPPMDYSRFSPQDMSGFESARSAIAGIKDIGGDPTGFMSAFANASRMGRPDFSSVDLSKFKPEIDTSLTIPMDEFPIKAPYSPSFPIPEGAGNDLAIMARFEKAKQDASRSDLDPRQQARFANLQGIGGRGMPEMDSGLDPRQQARLANLQGIGGRGMPEPMGVMLRDGRILPSGETVGRDDPRFFMSGLASGNIVPGFSSAMRGIGRPGATLTKPAMRRAGGGQVTERERRMIDKAYEESLGPSKEDMDMARTIRDIPSRMVRGAKKMMGMGESTPAGSVTKTEKSVTVAPAKKRGGKC